MIKQVLADDFSITKPIDVDESKKKEFEMTGDRKNKIMEKINQVDWPYFIKTQDGQWEKPINNIDCMRIYFKL